MNIIKVDDWQSLSTFSKRKGQLAILERDRPANGDTFFQALQQSPFRVIGRVTKDNSAKDIRNILQGTLSDTLRADPFYHVWVLDMAELVQRFCTTLGSDAVGFCLGTKRGCRRYHIDKVPFRCLVTYSGQGTEWIPDEAADREAFISGAPNSEIVKDPDKRQFMTPWHVGVFRGGSDGLLHRTPDSALDRPSILLRLDHAAYWDELIEFQQDNQQLWL